MKRMIFAMLVIASWSCTSKRAFIRTENHWIGNNFFEKSNPSPPLTFNECKDEVPINQSFFCEDIPKPIQTSSKRLNLQVTNRVIKQVAPNIQKVKKAQKFIQKALNQSDSTGEKILKTLGIIALILSGLALFVAVVCFVFFEYVGFAGFIFLLIAGTLFLVGYNAV